MPYSRCLQFLHPSCEGARVPISWMRKQRLRERSHSQSHMAGRWLRLGLNRARGRTSKTSQVCQLPRISGCSSFEWENPQQSCSGNWPMCHLSCLTHGRCSVSGFVAMSFPDSGDTGLCVVHGPTELRVRPEEGCFSLWASVSPDLKQESPCLPLRGPGKTK